MADTQAPDDTTIHYSESGNPDGDAVILVHGITENETAWAPITERLSPTHRVITLDLRGHGQSGNADRYDLEAMAGDVATVAAATRVGGGVHLVGHSLGGAVVSAVGAVLPVASVVNVDQSLQLGAFKGALTPIEPLLRDAATFPSVIDAMFADMYGPRLPEGEVARLGALRRPEQDVVLGVWELIFSQSEEDVAATVEAALSGFAGQDIPYLALFGADPGPDYGAWLERFISGAITELWPDHGHYPHLVDPDRFVSTLTEFWASTI